MKKILLFAIALISSALVFTACDDDRDSNPTLHEPTEFVLNQPAYAQTLLDLESSETMTLTFSQPNYGYTAAVTYQVQVSLDNDWSLDADDIDEDSSAQPTCATVNESYTSCVANVSCSLLARAIMEVAQWEDEESVPSELEVYVRMIAAVDKYVTPSNDVTIRVIPMYVALDAADPEIWYIVGNEIGDGKWDNGFGVSAIPMSTVPNAEYDKNGQGLIQYIGYFLSTGGFKLKRDLDNWDNQWGGVYGDAYEKNNNGDNITVPEDGYYVVSLNTATDVLTVEPYDEEPDVFDGENAVVLSGDFNGWSVTDYMTPVSTVDGVINHDWVCTLEISDDGITGKFEAGSWQKGDWGSNTSAFPFGICDYGGSNIPVPAGKYTVYFNDITTFYYFIEE